MTTIASRVAIGTCFGTSEDTDRTTGDERRLDSAAAEAVVPEALIDVQLQTFVDFDLPADTVYAEWGRYTGLVSAGCLARAVTNRIV